MKNYKFKINGKDYSVDIQGIEGRNASLTVNGVAYQVELADELPSAPAPVQAQPKAPAPAQAAPTQSAPSTAPAASGAAVTVKSPLPGVIISIDVNVGDTVRKGQKVAVLEAMKMENEIQSETDGTVSEILVHRGDSVLEGAALVKIA